NLINVESHIILGSVSSLHKDKVGRLSKYVHNNPYGIMLLSSLQKTNHEFHILNPLTIRTLGYVFCNVLLHTIPPINLHKVMIHLGGTWMNGIFGTMGLCNNPGPQIINIWYTQPVLIPKYTITS
ncbi:hypothetical protein EJD97_018332, partial [Solanum chilense]